MRIAYLILAHKDFAQLKRLVDRLDHEQADIYVHIDKKVHDDIHALFPASACNNRVTLVAERVDVKWGGYSQVEATINGLKAIVKSNTCYDYINLISGQDYPLKHNDFIFEFLASNKGTEFINCFELTPERWPEGMMRFERYWFNEFIAHELICSCVQYAATKILPKRKMPNRYKAYAGSQWWTLSSDCVRYVLEFVDNNAQFLNFFKATRCPDELLFQTVIMNSKYKERVCDDNLRYIDWSEGNKHPKILTKNDMRALMASNRLFARKFDIKLDEEVMELIDCYLCNKLKFNADNAAI